MLQQLTEQVWYLPHEEERDRPVLTYIRGRELSIAVDAGSSPAHVNEFYGALRAAGLPLPTLTVLTHWHWDHSFGLCAVAGQTLCSQKTAQKLMEVRRWQWTEAAMEQRLLSHEDIPFCHEHMLKEYPHPEDIRVQVPAVTLEGGMELDLGDMLIRLFTCDSPHSRDALLVDAGEALIIGDAGYEDFYELDRAYDPARLSSWIQRMQLSPARWLIQGHQEPVLLQDALTEWNTILRSIL